MAKKEVSITGATILGILFVAGAIILIAQQAFYIFSGLAMFFLIIGVAVFLVELFVRDHDFTEWNEYFSLYIFGAFLVCGFISLPMYFVGFVIGGSTLGQAAVQTNDALTGAEEQISDSLKTSIDQVVAENCKILDENNCNLLKQTAASAQTFQQVADKASELQNLARLAQKVTKNTGENH